MLLYRNQQPPQSTPVVLSPRRIPVIARLVLDDLSEECWPAVAIRWSPTHVLVSVQLDPGNPDSTTYLWLLADDVARVLRTPPAAGPTTGSAEPAATSEGNGPG